MNLDSSEFADGVWSECQRIECIMKVQNKMKNTFSLIYHINSISSNSLFNINIRYIVKEINFTISNFIS